MTGYLEVTQMTNAVRSWRVEVIADGSGQWVPNGVRWPTEAAAKAAGEDLFVRWTAVREWRVMPSEDPPNR